MTKISEHPFGMTKDGKSVSRYRLDNGRMTADILTLGGTILSIRTPDKFGTMDDVCLGFETVREYEAQTAYIGAIVGRYANRIKNACFSIGAKEYHLSKNDGRNCLHGGKNGLNQKVWQAQVKDGVLVLTTNCPDGEDGFPGNMTVSVCYTLNAKNELTLLYTAQSDQDTVCNLTNHSYFNLNGRGKGDILFHDLKVNAESITKSDAELIPTGELLNVSGTPFDFREFHPIGERMNASSADLENGHGYDHNFVLNSSGKREAAVLKAKESGRKLTVSTDLPGIQIYSGNFLGSGTNGRFKDHSGVALETQFFPDSPNHPQFPSCLLLAGEARSYETSYCFDTIG